MELAHMPSIPYILKMTKSYTVPYQNIWYHTYMPYEIHNTKHTKQTKYSSTQFYM